MNLRYRLDVWKARLRPKIKRLLPHKIARIIEQRGLRSYYLEPSLLLREDIPPWTSPNIWQMIEENYLRLEEPRLFEYGMGASTIKHFENLAKKGSGVYHGVEIDPGWYWIVATAIIKKANQLAPHVLVDITSCPEDPDVSQKNIDLNLRAGNLSVYLHLRTDQPGYIHSLNQEVDVVVIDGSYRKECVRHILSTAYLCSGGLLMLMEAGRGAPDWWEGKLSGDKDYSDELRQLIHMGGELVDGNGVDRWEGTNRKSPPPTSYFYPMEACKLIMPAQVNNSLVEK